MSKFLFKPVFVIQLTLFADHQVEPRAPITALNSNACAAMLTQ